MIAEFNKLNVALTVPVVWLGAMVANHWLPKTLDIFRDGGPKSGEDWLIAGVAIGFFGFVFNASFWGLHFLSTEMEWPKMIQLTYKAGPPVNIVTRHIPYIASAYCHLRAHWHYRREERLHPRSHLLLAAFSALLSWIALQVWAP